MRSIRLRRQHTDIGWLCSTAVEYRSLSANCPYLELDLQLTGDHLCWQTVRCRSANQANSAFHPFEVGKLSSK